MLESAADAGADLCHLFDRGEPVEAGHQRILQRRRDRKRRQRARHHIVIAGVGEEARLDHGLGQLLDEQGHTLRLSQDLVFDVGRQRLATAHAVDDR